MSIYETIFDAGSVIRSQRWVWLSRPRTVLSEGWYIRAVQIVHKPQTFNKKRSQMARRKCMRSLTIFLQNISLADVMHMFLPRIPKPLSNLSGSLNSPGSAHSSLGWEQMFSQTIDRILHHLCLEKAEASWRCNKCVLHNTIFSLESRNEQTSRKNSSYYPCVGPAHRSWPWGHLEGIAAHSSDECCLFIHLMLVCRQVLLWPARFETCNLHCMPCQTINK